MCKPCSIGTVFCPTSNVCINTTQWCDGVEDCPDDEINCSTTVTTTVTPPPPTPTTCPLPPICDDGYTLKQKSGAESASIIKGVKGGTKGGTKGRPKPERLVECPEYECIKTNKTVECPKLNCPDGYDIIQTQIIKDNCPVFRCEIEPKEEICIVDGQNFKTFDGINYKYEICNHILAQDKDNSEWKVTGKKIIKKVFYFVVQIIKHILLLF